MDVAIFPRKKIYFFFASSTVKEFLSFSYEWLKLFGTLHNYRHWWEIIYSCLAVSIELTSLFISSLFWKHNNFTCEEDEIIFWHVFFRFLLFLNLIKNIKDANDFNDYN
jgi:hypothetical protein